MTLNIRRIVTTHSKDGKAIVGTDEVMANVQQLRSGNFETLLWVTDDTPADVDGEDPTAEPRDIEPPVTGSIFRIIELSPGKDAYMHQTNTIDYLICMSGKCDMLLDNGETVDFKAGDVMVQRGTWHGWVNPYDEPCQIGAVLIGSHAPVKQWDQDAR
jgi:quercetin dioxygenase-like cupin family protein